MVFGCQKNKMHEESLDELMAQFRQLEKETVVPSPKTLTLDDRGMQSSTFSFKRQMFWLPYLVVVGSLFLFVVLLVSVFRPAFLYSSEQKFLWKRFFMTVFFTFCFLLGTLYGLYYYVTKYAA